MIQHVIEIVPFQASNDDEWDSSDEDQTDIEEAVAIQNMSQSDRSVSERVKYEPYDSKVSV